MVINNSLSLKLQKTIKNEHIENILKYFTSIELEELYILIKNVQKQIASDIKIIDIEFNNIYTIDKLFFTPKLIAAFSASILFTTSSCLTNWSITPLIVVINSINHHYLFPKNNLAYMIDICFNITSMLWYSFKSKNVCFFSILSAVGWLIGQLMGGCNNNIGVWVHILLCQIPGVIGTTIAMYNNETDDTYIKIFQYGLTCLWILIIFVYLMLPFKLKDPFCVGWALVGMGIGIIGSYQGLIGYWYNNHELDRINELVILQIIHEIGSLMVEFIQKKSTNIQYCMHHILFLFMLSMYNSEWHDNKEQVYRLPNNNQVIYTERDMLYLLGCTEISSVFLQMITAANDSGWNNNKLIIHSLSLSKPIFAISYIGVRVLWWPIHAWPLIYKAMNLFVYNSDFLVKILGASVTVCMGGLSIMQIHWGKKIINILIKTLQN